MIPMTYRPHVPSKAGQGLGEGTCVTGSVQGIDMRRTVRKRRVMRWKGILVYQSYAQEILYNDEQMGINAKGVMQWPHICPNGHVRLDAVGIIA